MPQKTLLCVVAHPDDETFGAGGALIHAVAQGAKVVTVCATRGEAGEIMERSEATPETLPAVREAEYREAGRVLGVSESLLLGYRDSGMPGSPENEDPRSFIQQPTEQVVADILEVMERVRPDVVLTMDEGGGYGHPDHIFASKCALAAFEDLQANKAANGWAPKKFYYFTFPRSEMKRLWQRMSEENPDDPMAQIDPEKFGVPDEEITLQIDVSQHEEQLRRAFGAHASQMSPLERMPDDIAKTFLNTMSFIRAYPKPATKGDETDLFDGV